MTRTNRYSGRCAKCSVNVPAGAGSLIGPPWSTVCATCMPRTDIGGTQGPTRIRVALVDDGTTTVLFGAVGFLGHDLFNRFRIAVGGTKWDKAAKVNLTNDFTLAARIVARLQADGFLVDVEPDCQALLQAVVAQQADERGKADERIAATNAKLAARGLALYPFQTDGVTWLAPRVGGILGDDMGLGKTIQVQVSLPEAASTSVLVIAPAVAKGVWLRETRKWRPDLTPVVLDGKHSFRWPEPGEMVILNWDILPPVSENEGKGKAGKGKRLEPAERWKAFLKAWKAIGEAHWASKFLPTCPKGLTIVADEAHAIKNAKAARTMRFRALAARARELGGRTWLLTATPLLNKPAELWSILTAADLATEAFGSYSRFFRIAGGVRTRFGTEWDANAIDHVAMKECLQKVMLRRIKTEVLKDLPAKTYATIDVALPRAITKLCDAAVAAAEKRGMTIEQALRVAVESEGGVGFEEISKARAALATAKLDAAIEKIEEFEEAEEPIVVASAYRAPIDALATRPGWAIITGSTSAKERTRIEEAFQRGELRGIGMTIKAGGVAITLTRATNMLQIDREWNPALNSQAEDRIYRIGTSKPVTIYRMVADHAIDQRLDEILAEKATIIAKSIDAARVQVGEVPEEQAADLDRAAAELEKARADLEVFLVKQRELEAEFAARRAQEEAARIARENESAEEKAQRKAHESLQRRTGGGKGGKGGAKGHVGTERRAARNEREVWAQSALGFLAANDTDHAFVENDIGFNKADQAIGHGLARRVDEGLSDVEWKLAAVVCAKYWRQVGPMPGGPIDLAERGEEEAAS